MEELTIRTLDAGALTPCRAYAALRAKAPGRTSFLLERHAPDERGEHLSTIGFLTKVETAYPPVADMLRELVGAARESPAASEDAASRAACARDVVTLLAFDMVLPMLGVPPWPDQPFIGREMRDITSIVFDHRAATITIVATNPNVVERCARTLTAAPELPELPQAEGTKPEHFVEDPPDPAFKKMLTRAERKLALGGLSRLCLGRTFKSQPAGADPFDVYRALRETAGAAHSFFVDMPASPMFGATAFAAAGSAVLSFAEADAKADEVLSFFAVEEAAGAPAKDALMALKDMDTGARGMRGGALARVRPGGRIELYRADTLITFADEQLQAHGAAQVIPGRDAASHTEAAAEDILPALTAIRRAQDAAKSREPAS